VCVFELLSIVGIHLNSLSRSLGLTMAPFHCDEALAVYMLRLTEAYRNAGHSFHPMNITRCPDRTVEQTSNATRDPNTLDTCDIVVDVGAVYDESKQRFDHHQRGFEEVFWPRIHDKVILSGPHLQVKPFVLVASTRPLMILQTFRSGDHFQPVTAHDRRREC